MALTRADFERDEAEQARRKRAKATAKQPKPDPKPTQATAQNQQPQQQEKPPSSARVAGESAEEQQRQRGPITEVGEFLDAAQPMNLIPNIADSVNSITPEGSPLKGATQFLADKTYTVEEAREKRAEQVKNMEEAGETRGNNIANTAMGLAAGTEAGLAMPFTVAARLSNQAAPWSDPPAVIKDNPYGETAFAIAEILVPSLLTGGVAGKIGMGKVLVGESLVETATQDSANDLLFGRELAIKLGEMANNLGFNGDQLTRDLVEGTKPEAQVMIAVAGFLQNLGINYGAEQLIGAVSKRLGKSKVDSPKKTDKPKSVPEQKEEVKEFFALDEGNDGLINRLRNTFKDDGPGKVKEPTYTANTEPHEVLDVDTLVPVREVSQSRQFINDPELIKRVLSKNNLADDGMDAAGRTYFTNYKALTAKKGLFGVLQEATETLRSIRPAGVDLDDMVFRASAWLGKYVDEASVLDPLAAARDLPELIVPIDPTLNKIDIPNDQLIYNKGQVTQEGFIASAVIAEELGTRMAQAARVASNLDSAGIDFTKQVDNFMQLSDLAQQVLIPLRRGKRRWAIEGFAQQRRVIDNITEPTETLMKDLSLDSEARNFETQIKDSPADRGVTARELWNAYKAGDQDAGRLLKNYMAMLGTSKPSTALANIENLGKALYDTLSKTADEAGTRMYYAYMLTRLSPQQAAFSSNILQLIKQPLGLFLSGDRAQAMGQFLGGMGSMADAVNAAAEAFRTGRGLTTSNRTGREIVTIKQAKADLDTMYAGVRKQLARDNAPLNERIYYLFLLLIVLGMLDQ